MPATVVILTKLPGILPVKTRLWPVLGETGARELCVAMVRDTVELARTLTPRPILAYSPWEGDPRAALPGVTGCGFLPLRSEGGAACLEEALAACSGGRPLIALGGDAPDIPAERLRDVVARLERRDAALVPSGDGGFSCLGLRRPVPGLGGAFSYGGNEALAALEAFLVARGLSVATLDPWPDIDSPADLVAYRDRQAARTHRSRILFICVENSNRSQMAEAFARMAGAEAWSAGSRPSGIVSPAAIAAMCEVGYDLSTHRSKSLDELPQVAFDCVVAMGCGDACPALPARRREEWSVPDPRHMAADGIRRVRDLIRENVSRLVPRMRGL